MQGSRQDLVAFDARYTEIFTATLKRYTCVVGNRIFRLKERLSYVRHTVTCAPSMPSSKLLQLIIPLLKLL